jgi:hypothetical protein
MFSVRVTQLYAILPMSPGKAAAAGPAEVSKPVRIAIAVAESNAGASLERLHRPAVIGP